HQVIQPSHPQLLPQSVHGCNFSLKFPEMNDHAVQANHIYPSAVRRWTQDSPGTGNKLRHEEPEGSFHVLPTKQNPDGVKSRKIMMADATKSRFSTQIAPPPE